MATPCSTENEERIDSSDRRRALGAAEDAALVQALCARDPRAWRELERTYGRLIVACVRRVLGRFRSVASEDDVDDVRAIVLSQLVSNDMHRLRSFDASRGVKLGTWLGMLATHAAWDHLRSARRFAAADPDCALDALASDAPDAFDVYARRERAEQVDEIFADMSAKDREFLELFLGRGLEPDAIAAEMGISVKTVYSKKHKIRARLEGVLAALGRAA